MGDQGLTVAAVHEGMLEVVLATRNPGKASEMARLFGGTVAVRALPESVMLPPETGATFAENARLKACSAFCALGGEVPVLADDSGLEVAALGGLPGVMSARYAGEQATDAANVHKLLSQLAGCAERTARFVCCLCLILPNTRSGEMRPEVFEARGVCEGTISEAPRGAAGFGYDPVFVPRGWEVTLAEAAPEAKDGVSHRGAAARALLEQLREKGLVPVG